MDVLKTLDRLKESEKIVKETLHISARFSILLDAVYEKIDMEDEHILWTVRYPDGTRYFSDVEDWVKLTGRHENNLRASGRRIDLRRTKAANLYKRGDMGAFGKEMWEVQGELREQYFNIDEISGLFDGFYDNFTRRGNAGTKIADQQDLQKMKKLMSRLRKAKDTSKELETIARNLVDEYTNLNRGTSRRN